MPQFHLHQSQPSSINHHHHSHSNSNPSQTPASLTPVIQASHHSFGHLDHVSPGQHYPSRILLSQAGVHRPPQAGISGTQERGGAESVVMNGGYPDGDGGDIIWYMGSGGLRCPYTGKPSKLMMSDQTFQSSGNAALQASYLNRRPVRVIRGADAKHSPWAPSLGYRYDGLYSVTFTSSIIEPSGETQFKCLIFRLERIIDSNYQIPIKSGHESDARRKAQIAQNRKELEDSAQSSSNSNQLGQNELLKRPFKFSSTKLSQPSSSNSLRFSFKFKQNHSSYQSPSSSSKTPNSQNLYYQPYKRSSQSVHHQPSKPLSENNDQKPNWLNQPPILSALNKLKFKKNKLTLSENSQRSYLPPPSPPALSPISPSPPNSPPPLKLDTQSIPFIEPQTEIHSLDSQIPFPPQAMNSDRQIPSSNSSGTLSPIDEDFRCLADELKEIIQNKSSSLPSQLRHSSTPFSIEQIDQYISHSIPSSSISLNAPSHEIKPNNLETGLIGYELSLEDQNEQELVHETEKSWKDQANIDEVPSIKSEPLLPNNVIENSNQQNHSFSFGPESNHEELSIDGELIESDIETKRIIQESGDQSSASGNLNSDMMIDELESIEGVSVKEETILPPLIKSKFRTDGQDHLPLKYTSTSFIDDSPQISPNIKHEISDNLPWRQTSCWPSTTPPDSPPALSDLVRQANDVHDKQNSYWTSTTPTDSSPTFPAIVKQSDDLSQRQSSCWHSTTPTDSPSTFPATVEQPNDLSQRQSSYWHSTTPTASPPTLSIIIQQSNDLPEKQNSCWLSTTPPDSPTYQSASIDISQHPFDSSRYTQKHSGSLSNSLTENEVDLPFSPQSSFHDQFISSSADLHCTQASSSDTVSFPQMESGNFKLNNPKASSAPPTRGLGTCSQTGLPLGNHLVIPSLLIKQEDSTSSLHQLAPSTGLNLCPVEPPAMSDFLSRQAHNMKMVNFRSRSEPNFFTQQTSLENENHANILKEDPDQICEDDLNHALTRGEIKIKEEKIDMNIWGEFLATINDENINKFIKQSTSERSSMERLKEIEDQWLTDDEFLRTLRSETNNYIIDEKENSIQRSEVKGQWTMDRNELRLTNNEKINNLMADVERLQRFEELDADQSLNEGKLETIEQTEKIDGQKCGGCYAEHHQIEFAD
ncbi:hypothetical protein O181_000870 [Austropuccinia psidii MF-1]|uniref:YDG domain-containing protein n=1 Tax=Austropuccinia psidii MF-1 TaxID=1389203 RepID=A0A9Q3GBA1_9BASI|nr:hypothetical protein [Austropuccinia psidii MF-1]